MNIFVNNVKNLKLSSNQQIICISKAKDMFLHAFNLKNDKSYFNALFMMSPLVVNSSNGAFLRFYCIEIKMRTTRNLVSGYTHYGLVGLKNIKPDISLLVYTSRAIQNQNLARSRAARAAAIFTFYFFLVRKFF